ncbi:MAG: EAL domain-containing protein [Eubacterium sp.]|nr:EAL domain-containing protein [Eubacterium sp.]
MDVLKKYDEESEHWERKVLIVDDEKISCDVLRCILQKKYEILTAENGQEALEILQCWGTKISLILLDLLMPTMNGYEFLTTIMSDSRYSAIPVIVTTAKDSEEDEIWCLENGAADFVSKPYQPEVVKRRVDSIIRLRETAAILNVVEKDHLTGLYSKESFYLEVERILEKNPDRQYDMVVADMENFKAVNECLGIKIGDQILCYMAKRYKEALGNDGICTRMHGDVFAMLVAHGDGSWKEKVLWQWNDEIEEFPLHNKVIKYGVYENVNKKVAPFSICDRAILALNRIKNRYGVNVSLYDDSLRKNLLRERQILDEMENALTSHQFQVYYQPKYDIYSDTVSGAEALIRWKHPEMGFLSPGEFIPIFERNGFITRLDFYVWEEVCRAINEWKKQGWKVVPVSVNISRMDFGISDLAERITMLAEKYQIDRELLHLEITESVYTDEPQYIIQTVKVLRDNGFKIEMDDFGSGYSSLNMLSKLSIDVLKLDMKFIQKSEENQKNILGFVISLAKWMNLATVAEGVETQEQVERLKSFGCDYVQGYFFAKPMPGEEFENYLIKGTTAGDVKEDNQSDDEMILEINYQNADTVLVVEDNEMNREILCHMLSSCYHVVETCNGREACEYVREHPGETSVILLDMVMPVMDGFQFMKERKNDPELSGIPVIITSESEEESELEALRLGAERFVGKPYRRELLLLSIQNAIERWSWRK